MKILYYDCFSGISGDMNLGALIDLGVDPAYLIQELSKLGLEQEYSISIIDDQRKGVTGKRVQIKLKHSASHHNHPHHRNDKQYQDEPHNHQQPRVKNDHHNQNHEHNHNHNHTDSDILEAVDHKGHVQRSLTDIVKIIESSSLAPEVKKRSLKMFDILAEAEGQVHGISKHDVHFHEVGAIDSILDIVGAAICLEKLNVDRIISSPIELGGGFVRCQHGLFPVPAPAVMALVQGIPVKTGRVPFETTTPTGAVILAANVDEYTERINFKPLRIGYGVGKRDTDIPNVLRVCLGECDDSLASAKLAVKSSSVEIQVLIETNIDDMNPELFEYVEEKLFTAGARDVFKTPIIMKRGRPAVKLSVLSTLEDENVLKGIILRETTAIGLRSYEVKKTALDRECQTVETPYGPVNVKLSYYEGELIRYKAEYKDCKKISEQYNIPLHEVYRVIARANECNDM